MTLFQMFLEFARVEHFRRNSKVSYIIVLKTRHNILVGHN